MDEIIIPSVESNQELTNPGSNNQNLESFSRPLSVGTETNPIPSQETQLPIATGIQPGQRIVQTPEGTFVIETGQQIGTEQGNYQTQIGTGECEGSFTIQCLSSYGLVGMIPLLMAYAFIFAGVLSVLFIFWGGITFILSGGDDEKVKKSVNTIRYAILGFVVAVFSYFVVGMVGKFLGINIADFVSYDQILGTIKSLTPSSATPSPLAQ